MSGSSTGELPAAFTVRTVSSGVSQTSVYSWTSHHRINTAHQKCIFYFGSHASLSLSHTQIWPCRLIWRPVSPYFIHLREQSNPRSINNLPSLCSSCLQTCSADKDWAGCALVLPSCNAPVVVQPSSLIQSFLFQLFGI